MSESSPVSREAAQRPSHADSDQAGYVSADHHVHLNASGQHELEPTDLVLPMRAEDLDWSSSARWRGISTMRIRDADHIDRAWLDRAAGAWLPCYRKRCAQVSMHMLGKIGVDEAVPPVVFQDRHDPLYVAEDIAGPDGDAQ